MVEFSNSKLQSFDFHRNYEKFQMKCKLVKSHPRETVYGLWYSAKNFIALIQMGLKRNHGRSKNSQSEAALHRLKLGF